MSKDGNRKKRIVVEIEMEDGKMLKVELQTCIPFDDVCNHVSNAIDKAIDKYLTIKENG